MAYVATIHHPGSIRHAITLKFLSPTDECLAVAKSNRLEFYVQTPDGFSLQQTRSVYGKVTMLNKIRPASSMTEHLFVGTDRFMYFTIYWDPQTKQIKTGKSYVDQADKSARDSQTGDRCLIDQSGRFMTLEIYEGVVTVIPIAQKVRKQGDPEIGSLCEPIPVRILEFFVRSSTFFQTRLAEKEDRPRLALLYEDSQKRVRIKVRRLACFPGGVDAGTAELLGAEDEPREEDSPQESFELGATHIIPVPFPTCGLLVLGETSITYYEHWTKTIKRHPLKEATIFVAWTAIDRQRFVLADEYGKLYMLMLELNRKDEVDGWKLEVVGETCKASVLVHLGDGKVFVGSHQGDSQIVAIQARFLETLQEFPNLAPILDLVIMDMGSRAGEGQTNEYSSGQARLVAGSGAFTDGSLRSVRSGVGIEDLGVLGKMENITAIFGLKSNPSSRYDDTLLVSFVDETRILGFKSTGEVEEIDDFKGLSFSEGTLLAQSTSDGHILQVTGSGARLLDVDSGMLVAEWTPNADQSITAASANNEAVVISVGGTTIMALSLTRSLEVSANKTFQSQGQIACVNVSMELPVCIIGYWHGTSVSVLELSTLEPLHTEVMSTDNVSVPRSLLLVDVLEDQDPVLFVAMADGNVITYNYSPLTHALSNKRSMVLGTQQANFKALPRGNNLYNVFATGEHSSLIYGSEGRLVYSAITAGDASCVCSFDAEFYPGAIAIATKKELKLANVDEERSTHVQTLHIRETVRRLSYSSDLKVFCLGTIKRSLEDGVEIIQSSLKITDEVMFKVLATQELNDDELVESVMRCKLSDGYGNLEERFVVGTAYLDDEQVDAIRGRILVFELTADFTLNLLLDHAVKGACRCLAMVGGNIVAALVKTVVVYSFEYETPSTPFLRKTASYRTSTAPIDIAVTGTSIAVADLMKSVTIINYTAGTAITPAKLTETARHFSTTWATSVAQIGETTFLEGDAEGNLLVLEQDVRSEFADDRRRLRVTSEMRLGEMTNRIRSMNVPEAPGAAVVPKAFVATVEGSIYLFGLIAKDKQNLLMQLQSNLARFVETPGYVPFMKYRAFRNQVREEEEPMRFVDGELVEKFLGCTVDVQEEVVKGLGVDVDAVRGLVEGLRRLK